MQIIRWTDGGFGMACHNYDGDMLTDEVAQVHRSPGFITSNLTGKRDDGVLIKEFEASHGTVADLWHAHLRGQETSMNPLGMVVALLGAMEHAATLAPGPDAEKTVKFTQACKEAVYQAFRDGRGTRDMAGPSGLTTEQFVDTVAEDLHLRLATGKAPTPRPAVPEVVHPSRKFRRNFKVDELKMQAMFDRFDLDKNGQIGFAEFVEMAVELGVAPLSDEAVIEQQKKQEEKTDSEATRGRIKRWASISEPKLY
mmetsp:Transcript_77748/g.218192  ORF Transcript_77748/g.218192 Transcript_77748/m.218192 type:complete len:254 (-) Transcript_77748:79-840(-)